LDSLALLPLRPRSFNLPLRFEPTWESSGADGSFGTDGATATSLSSWIGKPFSIRKADSGLRVGMRLPLTTRGAGQ